ncbi:hypothetical protein JDV02_003060 [Purpureocillium takamizusanense]|uniref:Uncharacterized protein n=1 Tax=Purpureocillium takamizusanense TaxID=2060973 RepID=A0A9Q8V8E8_9HYPO|nr:uncharacterized protein JDV02_003060 [Purpureocillium takamizusanense]UNI16638.1 hypothetical protein JDV02_003060 [Purpureocillium takamizusanense]
MSEYTTALPLTHQQQTHSPSRPLGPVLGIRRFGRNDFERFDQEAARGSHICLGSTTIGKVNIDCKYHWKKAQWGVLGVEKRPAGIVYMDITFRQPHGWWLEHASVFVTVGEDKSSYALAAPPRKERAADKVDLTSDYAVQITDYYGPRFLAGTKTVRNETRHMKITPTLGVPSVQVGGMGYESTSSHDKVGRWVFKGNVGKPKGCDGLRTLHWELTENCLDPEQAHSPEFRTGFAFEHSRRPLYLRVEMEGRLQSKGQQLRHGFKRFSSRGLGRKDDSTLMCIAFERDHVFEKSLDAVAQGLDMTMQMENLQNAPVEAPDPTPARFTVDTHTPRWRRPGPGMMIGPGRLDAIEERPETRQMSFHAVRQQDELLRLLRQTTENLHRPPTNISQTPRATIKMEETEETLVVLESSSHEEAESDEATESVDTEGSTPAAAVAAAASPSAHPQSADEALLEALKIPAIVYILRIFVMIMGAFSRVQQGGGGDGGGGGGSRPQAPHNMSNGKPQPGIRHYVVAGGKLMNADGGGGGGGAFRLDGARAAEGLSMRLAASSRATAAADGQTSGFLQRGQQTRIRSW